MVGLLRFGWAFRFGIWLNRQMYWQTGLVLRVLFAAYTASCWQGHQQSWLALGVS